MEALNLPPGYGLSIIPPSSWFEEETPTDSALFDRLLIWEPRQHNSTYVIGVDVSDGLGLDRSVIDVLRVGDFQRPDEQVAQFVTSSIDAITLAYIVDPIGRYFSDDDGTEALLAVETNNHGIGTQGELQRHCGYSNFFIWQYEDSLDPRKRYSRRIGWVTSTRTRPYLLSRYYKALTTYDPRTGLPDYRINSPITISELRDLVTPPGMPLSHAEAAPGAYDDAIMAGAISEYVAWTVHTETSEPLNERRRRLAEEAARRGEISEKLKARRDFQNTDATAEELYYGEPEEEGYLYE